MRRTALLLCLLSLPALAQDLHFAAGRPFDLEHLLLEGKVDLGQKTFHATAHLRMTALRRTGTIRLDAVHLEVEQVEVAKATPPQVLAATHANEGDVLVITLDQPLARGERIGIKVSYLCRDPEYGLAFFGPTKAEPGTPYQVWSQGETIGTRHWIPIFDHPNDRLTSELKITVAKDLQVLSNGRQAGITDNEDGSRTWHWVQEKDHVPYLISMVVGKFAVLRELWRGRPVEYWVPPDRKEDAMRSFGNTKRMLDFYSDRIGVEYPWSKYAQVVVEQFSFGGMENTSATTLNERTLHDERAHLDFSSDGLVSHELAHQWYGDLITCREWAHTWLNEGFATYFQALWTEYDKGTDEFLYDMLGKARSAIKGGKKLPIVHRAYKGPWEQFDARSYPKGAWVLHMIRRSLGDEIWWECVRHYTRKYAHACVETGELRRVIEEVSGRSFERFFYDWTERPGHPEVEVQHRWNEDQKLAEVRVRQTQKSGSAFHFPLTIEYRDPALAVTYEVKQKDTRYFVPLPKRPSMIRVDPDHAVLMELKEVKGRDLWVRQLNDDPDPLARVRAAEYLGGPRRDQDRRALGDALGQETFWGVQAEICKALGRSGGIVSRDFLLKALSLEHPKARKAAVEGLGRFRKDETALGALEALAFNGDASYSVEAAAITAWANQRPPQALERLKALLPRESHRELIREAVLKAMGEQLDPGATDLLLEWTARGRPRAVRRAALEALGKLAKSGRWDAATSTRVVLAINGCLDESERRGIKRAAVQALRDMGESSFPALSTLEALAEHDSNENVRKDAKEAIDKIRSGAPAPVELQRLRDELRKMRRERQKLQQRIERLERKQPAPPDDSKK
jgi:aminopeptidase N